MLARKTRNQRIPATYGRRHRASRARSTSLIEVVGFVVIVVAVIADAAARVAVVIRLVVALRIVVVLLAINLRVVVAVVASGGGVAVGSGRTSRPHARLRRVRPSACCCARRCGRRCAGSRDGSRSAPLSPPAPRGHTGPPTAEDSSLAVRARTWSVAWLAVALACPRSAYTEPASVASVIRHTSSMPDARARARARRGARARSRYAREEFTKTAHGGLRTLELWPRIDSYCERTSRGRERP